MIDIETLGLEPGAAILSVGATEFGPEAMGAEYEASITRESCEAAGLDVDEDTLEWWQSQDEAAREVLQGGEQLADVLPEFFDWLDGADEIWANSPKFDAAMLEAAAEAVELEVPWEFYELRDFRTLSELPMAPDKEQQGVEHDALDDAHHQAWIAATALKRIEQAKEVSKMEEWE